MTPLWLSKRMTFAQALQHEWHAGSRCARSRSLLAHWVRGDQTSLSGAFVPCIRDPDNNVILELDKKGWAGSQGLGPYCFRLTTLFARMIQSFPVPLAAIGGKLRPVFFVKNAFERAAGCSERAELSAGGEGLCMIESR